MSVDKAKDAGLKKVFALTYVPKFFQKQGFKKIRQSSLPHKVRGGLREMLQVPYTATNKQCKQFFEKLIGVKKNGKKRRQKS